MKKSKFEGGTAIMHFIHEFLKMTSPSVLVTIEHRHAKEESTFSPAHSLPACNSYTWKIGERVCQN
jgi:hypothetical protein